MLWFLYVSMTEVTTHKKTYMPEEEVKRRIPKWTTGGNGLILRGIPFSFQ